MLSPASEFGDKAVLMAMHIPVVLRCRMDDDAVWRDKVRSPGGCLAYAWRTLGAHLARTRPGYNITSFYGSSCATNGKDALNTLAPDQVIYPADRWEAEHAHQAGPVRVRVGRGGARCGGAGPEAAVPRPLFFFFFFFSFFFCHRLEA